MPVIRRYGFAAALLFILSIPLKLYASQLMVWEIDYVPVVARGMAFFNEGVFPAYGTLSSVAAYNLPFLVWLHMPAMLFTRDVYWIFLSTLLVFNALGTWHVYRLGARYLHPRAGLLAVALFTFSEFAISAAYTAWAQLLLPSFFAMIAYWLLRWLEDGDGRALALTCLLITAAFMTHFTAVLLYPALVLCYIIRRPPLAWRGLFVGVIGSALLLAPWLLFQVERDFVDLRAFLSRTPTVAPEIMAQYAYLKPESGPLPSVTSPEQAPSPPPAAEATAPPPQQASTPPTRVERLLGRIVAAPAQVVDGFMVMFRFLAPRELTAFYWPQVALYVALLSAFWGGVLLALWRWLQAGLAVAGWRARYHALAAALYQTPHGRIVLLFGLALIVVLGLIATRSPASAQSTYYYGLAGLQVLIIAYSLHLLIERMPRMRWRYGVLTAAILAIVGVQGGARLAKDSARLADIEHYSPFNVALYRSIDAATAWIADDWAGGDSLTISYDIMAESRHFWWIAPWHHVDPLYRIGMGFDYLLESYYGLHNRNQSPTGEVAGADYVVVYEPGLARYDLSVYEVHQFGAIYVLKPITDGE